MSESHPASPLDPRSITHSTEHACLLGTVVSTWSLMLIAVFLRFVARRLSKMALWYDDWLTIPAAVCQCLCPLSHCIPAAKNHILKWCAYQLSATTCFVSAIWSESSSHVCFSGNKQLQAYIHAYSTVTQRGLGLDIHTLSPNKLEILLKGIFISDIGWAIAICLTKCSILAFYWRIFKSQGLLFRITVQFFLVLMISWGIVVVSVNPLVSFIDPALMTLVDI